MPTPNDFTNFQFQPNRNAAGGDFSPSSAAPPAPEVPSGAYPSGGYDPLNRQFSTREEFGTEAESVPEILAAQTVPSIKAHADLNQAYGLNQPMATLGTHVWLRDELADVSEKEPANAAPKPALKTPFSGGQ